MTYLEICESVLEEVNGRGDTIPSVDLGRDPNGDLYVTDPTQRNIVRWVNDLYVQIQQQNLYATFMQERGVLFTTVPDQMRYEPAAGNVRVVDKTSLYLTRPGHEGRLPIEVRDYAAWIQNQRAGNLANIKGTPISIIKAPQEDWIVFPVPTQVWDVNGDWWREPTRFEDETDEPIWAVEYHDILKWRALLLLATEFTEEGTANVILERAKMMLIPLERAFKKRYSHVQTNYGASPLL